MIKIGQKLKGLIPEHKEQELWFSWSLPPQIEHTVESHHEHFALCQWQMFREMEILLLQPLSRRHCLHHCNQALHSGKAHQCKTHQRIISQLPIVATKTRRNIMHQPKAGCTASLVYLGTFGHDRSIYFQLQATKFALKQTQASETKRTNFHSIVQRKLDKTGIWNVHVVIWIEFEIFVIHKVETPRHMYSNVLLLLRALLNTHEWCIQ